MLGQAELLLVQLVDKGGPWGLVGAMLFVGWGLWRKIEPHVVVALELKRREVQAREKQALEAEKGTVVGAGISLALENLTAEIERVRKNGVKPKTESSPAG